MGQDDELGGGGHLGPRHVVMRRLGAASYAPRGPRHVVMRLGAAYSPRGRRKMPSSSRISARVGAKSLERSHL